MAKLLSVETTKRGSRLSEDNEYRATFDGRPEDEDDVKQALTIEPDKDVPF